MGANTTLLVRALDDEAIETLSSLALNAALEIDRLIRGKTADIQAIAKLTDDLRRLRESTAVGRVERLSFDPNKIVALSRALGAYTGHELSTIRELSDKINDLIVKYDEYKDTGRIDVLGDLLKFCVAVHKELLPLRRPIKDDWWMARR